MIPPEKDVLLEALNREINSPLFPIARDIISYQQILEKLSEYIRQLLATDFNCLVHLLYRIDVSRQKVTDILNEHPDKDAGSMIASLILERTLQKIQTRKQFRDTNKNIPDEEKW